MQSITLFAHYLLWHYTRAYSDLLHIAGNLLWFLYHFFSIPELTRTWFAPWKRLHEEPGSIINMSDYLSGVLMNLIIRVIGILLRTILITVGFCILALGALLTILALIIWTALPFIIVFSFIAGASIAFF
ncbi:MAG TPA: hypothetical protein DCZ84_01295 [Candidatus Vogelbacteria bacterium]|uniref:Peptidase S54 rhomboid domain-containing protein n=1 Tax=Candidatus Vogelbacteria bacterium RIFOXYD1_FULL_51_18 TaxID=1802440 RepID=A0A1G2QHL3_9BACT|nr:MAG: hypothetical protein UY66_C0002G0010 [Parcubacteria group bacterium GW2011_GWC1_51_35]KKW25248.1 MAG: hypothetical protein UY68_C0004G0031 [Parcubacteria group bacterium GW2011_GWF2_52_12]KKW28063.1 MAG: hypothetical protein UY69_C0001G0009 [Parcubacteria group bacterium GW2011_GWF1_52_5]KKW34669.1 MAG: hypothetical protein UY80_C0011G0007 [Parcubacteria group bacterium GW2011_GWB1_53_43]KKW38684.1 MAG: hypothetical protein UY88_C0003G0015 [Parcubacteria group bacterium GW2011_GWA1_54_8